MSKADQFKQANRTKDALEQSSDALQAVDRAIYDGDISGINWDKIAQQAQSKAVQGTAGEIIIGEFTLTPKGVIWHEGTSPSEDNWYEALELTFKIQSGLQWIIGDLIAFGETFKYGDAQAVAELYGRQPQTLYNYASVCRSFPEISRRRENLSFGHHEAVAAIKDEDMRDQLLTQAEEESWSVAKLRKQVDAKPSSLPEDTFVQSLKIQRKRMSKITDFISHAKAGDLSIKDKENALGEIAAARRWLDEAENQLTFDD